MVLYPRAFRGTETPAELKPGVDAETSTVDSTEPALAGVAVITMELTTQRSFPPSELTTTLTFADDVLVGADMTGPGIGPKGEGGEGGGDGDGDGDGDGGVFGTTSYRLISFHLVNVLVFPSFVTG